ncbi:MAG TPA: lipid-A-disaccharide synthase [Bryobacteraceae bacterium]|jgi:lipid-A-disaccharide synthase
MRILISAGEASGDLYASRVVEALRPRHPEADFFGCAGPRMQASGVRPIIDLRSIAVVGLVEVVAHIPRIYGQFRKLVASISQERPDLAILTDAPDFNLRLAKKLKRRGVPVVYLIAPQAWAWREGRVKTMRATFNRLLCIFPFEQEFFESHGVPTTYIGHPLARIVKPTLDRAQFCEKFNLDPAARIVALLPGSRHGEVARHIPDLVESAAYLRQRHGVTPILALPPGFDLESTNFQEPIRSASIQVIEGYTWDVLAQAELALAASGTVTVEAALLGVPMVTFYRVNALSWLLGRWLVRAPFLSMVNLVAGRRIVPELIQQDMSADRLAAEASRLLDSAEARAAMKHDLAEAADKLRSDRDPMDAAAEWIERVWSETRAT